MIYRLGIAGLIFFTFGASSAFSQIQMHSDYGGYSLRSGNSIYSYRDDGTTQEYHRFGNIGMYSDNRGTSGDSIYMNNGRFDSYRNTDRGWSGSGFTPFSAPQASTYSRDYSRDFYSRSSSNLYSSPRDGENRSTRQANQSRNPSRSAYATNASPTKKPEFKYERRGDSIVAYPLREGTTLKDFSKSGFLIKKQGDQTVAYPTIPGTGIRDHSEDPIVIRGN